MFDEMPALSSDRSASFDLPEMLHEFGQAIAWVTGLVGKRRGDSRFDKYHRALTDWIKTEEQLFDAGTNAIHTGLIEAVDLVQIWRSLRGCDMEHLPAKLQEYFTGAYLERAEDPDGRSHVGRDTGFELRTLARMRQWEFPAKLTPTSDICFPWDDFHVACECKRPQVEGSLRRAVQAGLRQLRNRRRVLPGGTPFCGILGLSLGKVCLGGQRYLRTKTQASFSGTARELMNPLIDKHASEWLNEKHAEYCHLILAEIQLPVFYEDERFLAVAEMVHVFTRHSYKPGMKPIIVALQKGSHRDPITR